MLKRTLNIDSGYLHIPIKFGVSKNELQFWLGGRLLYQFSLELSDGDFDCYCFLDVSELKNTKVDLIVPSEKGISQQSLDNIFIGQAPEQHSEYKDMYKEDLRPQFHFSSRRGWLNDPNGLYWHDGIYHMYYQHNPLVMHHGSVNVSWGHTVSEDLVHWKEQKDAILPWRRDWSVASGSAIIDYDNVAGYGKDAVIAAFTALASISEKGEGYPSGGQFLAASIDGGQSFYRFTQFAMIDDPKGEGWRDPRLFKENGVYYIAVYEIRDEVNGVSFYKSQNLHDWEFVSWTPNLFECPDLFKLKVEGTDEEKWVLFGADGLARIGSFEEGVFTDDGIAMPLDYGVSTYAGQTWSHAPNGRRIHISWVRGMYGYNDWADGMGYRGMPFSQCMSLPCEITLSKADGRYHICRFPVEELKELRNGLPEETMIELNGSYSLELNATSEIMLTIDSFANSQLAFELLEYSIKLDLQSAEAKIDDKPIRKLLQAPTQVRIFTDSTTIEICIGNEICATYAADTKGMNIVVSGEAKVKKQEWDLRSIW